MSAELAHRPQWDIDRVLEELHGQDVRVAAMSFSPAPWDGGLHSRFISPRELILPDNSAVAGLPLYFEGRLQRYLRQIGIVYAHLDSPNSIEDSAEGVVCFRGTLAVILRAPAIVKLAYPFRVEKIPADDANYWSDIRFGLVQFKLPL